MNNVKFLFILLSFMAVSLIKAQKEVKKPQEVFNIYFDAFVKNEESAKQNLNTYLRPTVEGQDMYTFADDVGEETKEAMIQSYSTVFSKNVSKAIHAELKAYFNAMMDNFHNAKYKVKSVKLVDNEYVEGQKIAEVVYDVSFLVSNQSIEKALPELASKPTKSMKLDEVKKLLTVMTNNLKTASNVITTEQKFSLYTLAEGGKTYYYNGNPSEIVTNLTDFYFDNVK